MIVMNIETNKCCIFCGAPMNRGSVCLCCQKETDWKLIPVCFSLSEDMPYFMTMLPSQIPFGSSMIVRENQDAAVFHSGGMIPIAEGCHSVFYHPRNKGTLCIDENDYHLSDAVFIVRQKGTTQFNETGAKKPRYYKICRVKPLEILYQAFRKYSDYPPVTECLDSESVIYQCRNCGKYVERKGKWCPTCRGRIYV